MQTLQRLIFCIELAVLDELATESHNFLVSSSHVPSIEHLMTGLCKKYSRQEPVDDRPSPGLPTAF